nr:HemD protein [Negativicutes bacterium]
MQKAGQVSLVGAGPGDWRLLTLGAKVALEQADVVVYDRLASERILDWVPEKAERIYVGKASSDHTMKQEDINQLLVEKAKQGCFVVRLKGGDPFVFGRGGEEAIACYDAGISFE